MKPLWVIQENMDGVDTSGLREEIVRHGMIFDLVPHRLGGQLGFGQYDPQQCILYYGEIDFVRQVITRAPFIPGAWCNFKNMQCSTYYAYLGEHLLNDRYIMMPVGDLLRQIDRITIDWCSDRVFIRPDSGAKPFTGYVVDIKEKHKIGQLVESVGPDTLVVVAPAKAITAEWRFVVCDRKVVTGCRYLPTESPDYPADSLRLAEKVSQLEWQPDLCYTVDIAESEGEMRVLELNSFSCSGFYECDPAAIVEHASCVAREEWADYCA